MDAIVRCPVNPTEDKARVCSALTNLFVSDSPCKENEYGYMTLMSNEKSSLDIMQQYIHALRIIDAVRKKVLSNWDGSKTSVFFDKQAAFYGKLRLVDETEEEPPLGCVELEIMFDDEAAFDEFLAWFVPPTEDGRIVNS